MRTAEHETDVAGRLGRFAAELRWEDLPTAVRGMAVRLMLDSIGVALGGARTPPGRRVMEVVRRYGGEQATVLGAGGRATVEGAAFANGTIGKIVGMEDSNRAYGHVATQVVPAALAACEAVGGDGRRLIRAVVAGYEVYGRIGRQVRATHIARGFDIKGTVGALGSAAAAAVALGLEADEAGHAIALAASLASGLETYVHDPDGCDTEWLISGFAARNGLTAASLAAAGFRGSAMAIEGQCGFAQAFGDGFQTEAAVAGLGQQFEIETAAFKPHAGCRHVHQGVDAALEVRRVLEIVPDAIAEIRVESYHHALAAPFRRTLAPRNPGEAAYSLPVATAVALVFGRFQPEDIARYDDPRVRSLAKKMRLAVEPDIEAHYPLRNGCVVRVHLRDGRVIEGSVAHARGEPENMLSDTEFEAKFRRLAADLLPDTQRETLIDRLWGLEDVAHVGEVTRLASSATRWTQ